MEKLWEKVKKSIAEGYTVAAEKTEELSKLGKLKLDMLNIKHNISKQFTELGGAVYEASKAGKASQVMKSEEVEKAIESIKTLEEELLVKEQAFEALKTKGEKE